MALTISGKLTARQSTADFAGDSPANANYRKVNIQVDDTNKGGMVTFEVFDAASASGVDALAGVGSSCTITIS